MKRTVLLLSVVLLAGCNGAYNAQNFTQESWAKKGFQETFANCRQETLKAYKKSTWLVEHGYDDVVENDFFIGCMDKSGYKYKSPYYPKWFAYQQPKGVPQNPDGAKLVADGDVKKSDKKPDSQDKSALYE